MISKESRRLDIAMGYLKALVILELIVTYGLVVWGIEKYIE